MAITNQDWIFWLREINDFSSEPLRPLVLGVYFINFDMREISYLNRPFSHIWFGYLIFCNKTVSQKPAVVEPFFFFFFFSNLYYYHIQYKKT
jgi:hypothetical protein